MAKTKKASKPTKITNEELNKLQDTVNIINKAQMQIGMLQSNIHQLLHHIAGKNDELALMQSNFKESYGTDDINISDGTIKYNENNQKNYCR